MRRSIRMDVSMCWSATVSNVGVAPLSLLERLKIGEWDQMIDVNIKGVLYEIAAALPHMIGRKAGQIINVSSLAALSVSPVTATHSATKQAVSKLGA